MDSGNDLSQGVCISEECYYVSLVSLLGKEQAKLFDVFKMMN